MGEVCYVITGCKGLIATMKGLSATKKITNHLAFIGKENEHEI